MDKKSKERRKFPRFKVATLESLVTRLDKHRTKERIVTLSLGGCGFYGFSQGWPLSPVQRVFPVFEFKFNGQTIGPIQAEGNIVYMKPMKINGRDVVYYGVEFLPSNREKIQPMIDLLETLSREGQVEIDGSYSN